MEALYIAVVLLCRFVQHLCTKPTSNGIKTAHYFFKYSAYRSAVSALLAGMLLFSDTFYIDIYSLLLSLAAVQYFLKNRLHRKMLPERCWA